MAEGIFRKHRYGLSLMIKHPAEKLHRISEELGLTPDYFWQVGDNWTLPSGKTLPGIRKYTYWCESLRYVDDKRFFEIIEERLVYLEAAAEYVHGLTDSSGTLALNVDLLGTTRIDDVLPSSIMLRMARLNVELGLEVFPNMRE